MENYESRNIFFKRNQKLEDFLLEINGDLAHVEKLLLEKQYRDYPIIFIVGPLRSGTTLTLQWLADTKEFAYPTNLLSRFYGAPIIGAKIQRLLTDSRYNFRDEIMDFNSVIDFQSENGKTKGALSPNEFWYFWRRFLPEEGVERMTEEELEEVVAVEVFRKELIGMANIFEKPFALKGLICNYNIPFLDRIFNKALFIYTKRNPVTNIESALKARERQFNNENEWYSFKIPEYKDLIKINEPVKQIAGQIYYINRAIKNGLMHVSEERKVVIEYEQFCQEPSKYYAEIADKLERQGYSIKKEYTGRKAFQMSRTKENQDIRIAYEEFVGRV